MGFTRLKVLAIIFIIWCWFYGKDTLDYVLYYDAVTPSKNLRIKEKRLRPIFSGLCVRTLGTTSSMEDLTGECK